MTNLVEDKFCTKCQTAKPLKYFSRDKARKDGRQATCKPCKAAWYAAWYEVNKNKPEFKGRKKDWHAAWYAANKDTPEYKSHKAAAGAAYRAANPEKNRAKTAKRRAAKLQRRPAWSDTAAIREFYEACPEGYHVDHIIPLQGTLVSGLHVLSNLQYLTASKNISKGNRFNWRKFNGFSN